VRRRIELRHGRIGIEHRAQRLFQRVEPSFEVSPVVDTGPVNGLMYLLRTC
jgi:hypothetical protein